MALIPHRDLKLRNLIYAIVSAGQIEGRVVGTDVAVTLTSAALSNKRTLMGNYVQVEALITDLVRQLRRSHRMWLRPKILIHLLPKFEGGYTDVELQAFREAGTAAGCAEVWLLADHDVATDEELESLFDGPLGMSIVPRIEDLRID